MAIWRGVGGAGDATVDATNEAAAAVTAANNAATSASAAAASATSAATYAGNAGISATSSSTSATNAANSATSATSSANTATTQATNASTSATAAASSASAASTAQGYAEEWATKAEDSLISTAAGGDGSTDYSSLHHAAKASASASAAASSASAASSSASTAATAQTNAANSATAAASSATSAAASYDSFDDRYLGAKSSAPTLDNDGDALLTGALYYNTTAGQLYIWNGSAWDDAAFSASGSVTSFNTRTGAVTLSAADVNTALGSDAVLDSDIIDEDDMSSNSATKIPTQQSVKAYVDTLVSSGIHYHTPVRVESPTALTVTYNNGSSGVGATLTNAGTQAAISIDGVALSLNDRVLIYTQADATQNGVYTVTTVGDGATNWVLTRATDADSFGTGNSDALGEGDAFFVSEGNTGAGELYVMNTSGTITFGTTNISFTQIAATAVYSGGTNIDISGTTINLDTSTNINFADNEKAVFGAGSDLQIYHDGSHSRIDDTGTGNLVIRATDLTIQSATNENYIRAVADGDVKLYYDNAEKLATTSGGVTVTGTVTCDGISMGDGEWAYFGASNDLAIGHDGSNSYVIENGTGALVFRSNTYIFRDAADTESIMTAAENGAVTLYYDNSAKLSTATGGVTVTGTVTCDGMSMGDAEWAYFGASNDMQVGHDGTNSLVVDNGTGSLKLRSNGTGVDMETNTGETMATFAVDGASTLYYDNSAKIATTTGGVAVTGTMTTDDLGIGTSSPSFKCDLKMDSATRTGGLVIRRSTNDNHQLGLWTDSGEMYFDAITDNASSAGITVFRRSLNSGTSFTESMRITNSGNVGIGTSTPNAKLHVVGDILASGNVTAYYSDDRLKTNLGKIENALEKVESLEGFYYEANETAQALGYKAEREVGISAQSVEKIMPEVVAPAPIDEKYLTVRYERLVPLLIESIKELSAEVKKLKGE